MFIFAFCWREIVLPIEESSRQQLQVIEQTADSSTTPDETGLRSE
jgi:hypothetical protein